MVRVHTDTQTISNIFGRNTDTETYARGDRVEIASDFQRGDEENGVWDTKQKQNFIVSLRRKYPTGILTFVKDHTTATSYNNPWKVLDGGNRLRAIRDFKKDMFAYNADNNIKFKDLTPVEQANFDAFLIPCQWLTIERDDPPDTIAEMFCRLNTSAKPLSHGELFKAHGWKKNIWEIEEAKRIIGDKWKKKNEDGSESEDHPIKKRWNTVFKANLTESARCDTLAMMIGYIISAKESDFTLFDKRYTKNRSKLSDPESIPTREEVDKIYKKINQFLDIMNEIFKTGVFGKTTRGIPSQTKIAVVWMTVYDGKLDENFKTKLIKFYTDEMKKYNIQKEYYTLLNEGSNGETTTKKIENVLNFIKKTVNI